MAKPDLDTLLTAPLLCTTGLATTLQQRLGPGATVVVFLRHFG